MLRPLPAAGYIYALFDNLGCKGDRLYVIIPHCLLQLFKSALRSAMTQANSITNEYQITVSSPEYQITVSSPVWQRVEQVAGEFNLSVYELLEQIGEGKLKVVAVPTNSEKLSDIANAFLWLASPTNVAI